VVNFGLFIHFNLVINQSKEIPPIIWMLASAIFVFSLVIAWFKDIPDMKGDQSHKISTLSIKLGAKKVFLLGNLILLLLYAAIITVTMIYSQLWNSEILIISHGIFILSLLFVASRIRPAEKRSMSRYYQFIWLLFFLEYIVFALSA